MKKEDCGCNSATDCDYHAEEHCKIWHPTFRHPKQLAELCFGEATRKMAEELWKDILKG